MPDDDMMQGTSRAGGSLNDHFDLGHQGDPEHIATSIPQPAQAGGSFDPGQSVLTATTNIPSGVGEDVRNYGMARTKKYGIVGAGDTA